MRSPHAYSPSTGALSQLAWGASVPAVLVNTQHEHAHKIARHPTHTWAGWLQLQFHHVVSEHLPPSAQNPSGCHLPSKQPHPSPTFYSPFTALQAATAHQG